MNERSTFNFTCFTQEQVKEINKKIKENIINIESSSLAADNATKKGKFFHVQCQPLMKLIHPWLYQCQQINREHFGYDISWDFHLDTLNYNVYGEDDEYEWHIDVSLPNSPMSTKLTCLLNLSEEPYEGGEFHVINHKNEIPFDSGMGVVFNSLIAHRVSSVAKGERRTLTYFAQGTGWR